MAGWKTVRITKPCEVRIDNKNLLIENSEHRFKLCLEDIDSIVFEGDRFMVSGKVLSSLSKHKIAVLFCDDFYMPSAIMHPFHQSSLATRTLKIQINSSEKFAKTLWKRIIEAKIERQKDVLCHYAKPYEKLDKYLSGVAIADKHNMEAKSARHYWSHLFGDLIRERESFDIRNQMLNYAYAILRSLISRDLSSAGFIPALGIWHDNKYNAFNLSDDLIEPFRPLVDLAIFYLIELHKGEEQITSQIKRDIIGIFDIDYIEYEEGLSSIRNSCKTYVQSFKNAIYKQDPELLSFPYFNIEKFYECI